MESRGLPCGWTLEGRLCCEFDRSWDQRYRSKLEGSAGPLSWPGSVEVIVVDLTTVGVSKHQGRCAVVINSPGGIKTCAVHSHASSPRLEASRLDVEPK